MSVSKPALEVDIETLDGKRGHVRAVFDTGSHRSLIRESCVPEGALVVRKPSPERLRTAAAGGTIDIVGGVFFVVTVGDRMFETVAHVAPNLSSELLIGAGAMQEWDITIRNRDGTTSVEVGRDVRDPEVQQVDCLR